MKAIAILTAFSLVAVAGCMDNERPATPPPSETSRAMDPAPPPPSPPVTSPQVTPPPSTPSTSPSARTTEPPAAREMARPEDTTAMGRTMASATDQELKNKIHNALQGDKALSASAKNIQISTTDGKVTLQGSVPSKNEKDQIATKVKQMDGVEEVDNQLQVASR